MIWQVTTTVETLRRRDDAELAMPSRFRWINESDIRRHSAHIREEYSDHELWELPSIAFNSLPTPILAVSDPSLRLDSFAYQWYKFSSGRLRQAMNVGADVVRFRNIDTSPSVPAIQAMDYAVFDVLPYANLFDPDRMAGNVRDVRQPDGSTRQEWVMDYANRLTRSPEVYFREGFVPPAPIFRGTGSMWLFATDEFADRVMRAGITDMAFMDITGPLTPERDRMRPLR